MDAPQVANADTQMPYPEVPQDVQMDIGVTINHLGLRLQTFQIRKRSEDLRGVIYLCHGYAAHSQFEWFLPPAPGEVHRVYEGSLLSRLVDEGFLVLFLDHQGHGRSQGARGLRAFFESFEDLAQEASDYVREVVSEDSSLTGLPVFVSGLSMGGCTATLMAIQNPNMYRGMVLMAPMISLDLVQEEYITCCVKNRHVAPFASLLSWGIPTLAIAAAATNEHDPMAQKELDDDPLTYIDSVRARVAEQFLTTTQSLTGGRLREVNVPFLTMHSVKDTFTDPSGSQALYDMAKVEDKTYLKVGPGADIDRDLWHALSTEKGCEAIHDEVLAWLRNRL